MPGQWNLIVWLPGFIHQVANFLILCIVTGNTIFRCSPRVQHVIHTCTQNIGKKSRDIMHACKHAGMGASAIPFLVHIPRQIQRIGE